MDFDEEPEIVKLQSDQFIVPPIPGKHLVNGEISQFQVELELQCCSCDDFVTHRAKYPIGDLRRFCRHLTSVRSEQTDDLHPFVRSLFDARDAEGQGMPNGSSFAFFEIDGRLGFVGENRSQKTYFFLTGIGQTFHSFTYDRKTKQWIGVKPQAPDRLLKFAFQARGQYGTAQKSPNKKKKKSRPTRATSEGSGLIRNLIMLAAIAGLAFGGYQLFKDGTPKWLAEWTSTKDTAAEKETSKTEQPANKAKTSAPAKKATGSKQGQAPKKSKSTRDLEPISKPPTSQSSSETENKNDSSSDEEPVIEFRQWQTDDGAYSVMAKYRSFANGKVTLIRQDNNEKIKIDEAELCQADRDYIDDIKKKRIRFNARQKRKR